MRDRIRARAVDDRPRRRQIPRADGRSRPGGACSGSAYGNAPTSLFCSFREGPIASTYGTFACRGHPRGHPTILDRAYSLVILRIVETWRDGPWLGLFPVSC